MLELAPSRSAVRRPRRAWEAVAAEPEHIEKLNFYVNAVDELLRWTEHGDGSTIGILLAADRDDVAVQYALRGLATPLAISTYTTYKALPDDVRPALPSIDDLTKSSGKPGTTP